MRKAFAIWLMAGLPVLADSVAATRSWVSNRVAEARAEWRGEIVSATNPVPSWISAAEGRAEGRLGAATNAVIGWIEGATDGLSRQIASSTNGVMDEVNAATGSLWTAIGGIEGATADIGALARTNDLPTKVSQLENDAGYLTNHVDVSGFALATGVFPDWTSKGTWSEGEFCTWKGVVYRFTGAGDPSAQPDISPVSWAVSDVGTAIAEARPDMSSLTNPIPSWIAAATGDVPARVSALVQSAVSGLDGKAATRLVSADGYRWIDGTGAVWQVAQRALWNGNQADAPLGETSFAGDGWGIAWVNDGTGVTGSWDLYRTLSDNGPLVAHFTADGLPYQEGTPFVLTLQECTVGGSAAHVGQKTDNGWYQIVDSVGSLHIVSPLTNVVMVVRVTNYVDRLSLSGETLDSGAIAPIVTNIVTKAYVEDLGIDITVDSALSVTSTNPVQNRVVTEAVNARPTKAEIEAGWWSEWTATVVSAENISVTGLPYYIPYDGEHPESFGWHLSTSQGTILLTDKSEADVLSFDEHVDDWYLNYTATRHRVAAPVPTKPEDVGAQPAGSYATAAQGGKADAALSRAEIEAGFTEWVFSPATFEGKVCSVGYDSGEWYLYLDGSMTDQTDPSPEDATSLSFADGSVTATRIRLPAMADIPVKTSDLQNDGSDGEHPFVSQDEVQHQQLAPVYSQTPTFSEWVCQPDIVTVYWDGYREMWATRPSEGTPQSAEAYNPNATNIVFMLEGDQGEVTATRPRTDVIGYTLGDQTNSVLAATNGLVSNVSFADATNRIAALEALLSGLESALHAINTGTNLVTNGGN